MGLPFWGPNNTDYNILGSILGSPYVGKLPNSEPLDYVALGVRVTASFGHKRTCTRDPNTPA